MLKIYLDNCCYNRPFDNQEQDIVRLETEAKLIIQDRIRAGWYSLVWSFVLHGENSKNLSFDKKMQIGKWEYIAKEYCHSSIDVFDEAEKFMAVGIKREDALHLACAIKCNCDYLITTDKKFLNKNHLIKGIDIVNPMVFIMKEG
ncbi:MAG: hypothetical protein LBE35_03320 [Clostridiales bacterium]|nr:hypothetical protein [Clostridiales bacterium]